jgi:hypothetical protein
MGRSELFVARSLRFAVDFEGNYSWVRMLLPGFQMMGRRMMHAVNKGGKHSLP